jgi:hypothetical protein
MRDGIFIFVSYKLLKWGDGDGADEGSCNTKGWNISSDWRNNTGQLSEGMLCGSVYLCLVSDLFNYLTSTGRDN